MTAQMAMLWDCLAVEYGNTAGRGVGTGYVVRDNIAGLNEHEGLGVGTYVGCGDERGFGISAGDGIGSGYLSDEYQQRRIVLALMEIRT